MICIRLAFSFRNFKEASKWIQSEQWFRIGGNYTVRWRFRRDKYCSFSLSISQNRGKGQLRSGDSEAARHNDLLSIHQKDRGQLRSGDSGRHQMADITALRAVTQHCRRTSAADVRIRLNPAGAAFQLIRTTAPSLHNCLLPSRLSRWNQKNKSIIIDWSLALRPGVL